MQLRTTITAITETKITRTTTTTTTILTGLDKIEINLQKALKSKCDHILRLTCFYPKHNLFMVGKIINWKTNKGRMKQTGD